MGTSYHAKNIFFSALPARRLRQFEPPPPIIRALTNSTHRVWEWASTERAVCSGPETPSGYQHLIGNNGGSSSIGAPAGSAAGDYKAYNDQVEVCDPSVGLESDCKLYPGGGGTYKPAGLFQKYGESTDTVCSKSFLACNTDSDCTAPQTCIQRGQMLFGLMTGSYTKNMSGGVIRSNISSMSNQVDNKNVGQLKSPGGAAGSDGFPITQPGQAQDDRLRLRQFSVQLRLDRRQAHERRRVHDVGQPHRRNDVRGPAVLCGKGSPHGGIRVRHRCGGYGRRNPGPHEPERSHEQMDQTVR